MRKEYITEESQSNLARDLADMTDTKPITLSNM